MSKIIAYKNIGCPVELTQIVSDDSGILEVVSEGELVGYISVSEIEYIVRKRTQ